MDRADPCVDRTELRELEGAMQSWGVQPDCFSQRGRPLTDTIRPARRIELRQLLEQHLCQEGAVQVDRVVALAEDVREEKFIGPTWMPWSTRSELADARAVALARGRVGWGALLR